MSNQYGFFFDASRCIKCWACEVACKQWNGIKAGTLARRKVREYGEGTFPDANRLFVSQACNHCEKPACVEVCPVGAIHKREEDGLVVGNRDLCIGCQSCLKACPFDIPQYRPDDGSMDKCDGCLECGQTPEDKPHCVATCPTQALKWGTLEEIAALAAEKGGERMAGDTNPCTYVYLAQ